MSQTKRKRVDVNLEELDGIVDSSLQQPLSPDEAGKLKTAIHAMADQLLAKGRNNEKTNKVLQRPGRDKAEKPPAPGHGRNGAADFAAAKRIEVPNEEFKSGDPCPECPKSPQGKVYVQKPRTLVRFIGQAPIQASVYLLESLRCNLCGATFTAQLPAGVSEEKYDETVTAMVASLKYGSGAPFNRIENLEKQCGVPLPSSTQWEIVEDGAELLQPVGDELTRQGAQYEVVSNDDTQGKILIVEREPDDKRTGIHTTAIVAESEDKPPIALFFTGIRHAGENLKELLVQRAADLDSPIQMADASSRNVPKMSEGAATVLANCLAHGRRHIVDVAPRFPEQCSRILDDLAVAFKTDAEAREQGLDKKARWKLHRERSGPVLKALHRWLQEQLQQKLVEPNSGLGKAMQYLLTHWRKLTLFLEVAGAPIDNNICERALKKAVLHRKNAYFYRTVHGAAVGDLYMSLIHTCELNGVPAFEYLTVALRNADKLRANPAQWMPWNYREQLQPAP